MKKDIPKIWIVILLYVSLIYFTLPVMRGFLNLLYDLVGKGYLSLIVNVILIAVVLLILYLSLNIGLKNSIMMIIPLIITLIWLFHLKRPEERFHFLEYGVLGVLAFKAFGKGLKKTTIAILFVLLIGTLDEFIQFLLPDRVGDIRDVIFNVAGGTLGVWMGLFYNTKLQK